MTTINTGRHKQIGDYVSQQLFILHPFTQPKVIENPSEKDWIDSGIIGIEEFLILKKFGMLGYMRKKPNAPVYIKLSDYIELSNNWTKRVLVLEDSDDIETFVSEIQAKVMAFQLAAPKEYRRDY